MHEDRRKRVLAALVEEHVRSAQPVSSQALVESGALECSAATVRNDLAALEECGYVSQPHVSSGRVPTQAGYRAFVDALHEGRGSRISASELAVVRAHYAETVQELEGLMRETATLLSRLTSYAAIVVAPAFGSSRVRKADLVALGAEHSLVVLITDDGRVLKRHVVFDRPVDKVAVAELETAMRRLLEGRLVGSLGRVAKELTSLADEWVAGPVIAALEECLDEADGTLVYHGGTVSLLDQPEFSSPEMVRDLMGLLEDGLLVARALSDVLDAEETLVRIGGENRFAALGDMTLVADSYGHEGASGVVGLIGPTRMEYSRAIDTVRIVAENLSASLDAALSE